MQVRRSVWSKPARRARRNEINLRRRRRTRRLRRSRELGERPPEEVVATEKIPDAVAALVSPDSVPVLVRLRETQAIPGRHVVGAVALSSTGLLRARKTSPNQYCVPCAASGADCKCIEWDVYELEN